MTPAELELINDLADVIALVARDCYFQLGADHARDVAAKFNGIKTKLAELNPSIKTKKGE